MEQDITSRLGRGFRNLLGFLYLAVFVWGVWAGGGIVQKIQHSATLNVPPQVNFKTCLHIKMCDDASFIGACSDGADGAPALPLPPDTPNAVECFFRTMF
jgi:hypothetical protein